MIGRRLLRDFVSKLQRSLRNIMSNGRSTKGCTPRLANTRKPSVVSSNQVKRAPNLEPLQTASATICDVVPVTILVNRKTEPSTVSGLLHLPQDYQSSASTRVKSAAILISGASGGVVGPSSIYLSMGNKLANLQRGIPVLRLDYRFPAQSRPCCEDVVSGIKFLKKRYKIKKFVLIGWSFGSAPVCTVAASNHNVIGCAIIAGQTVGTSGVRSLHPRPLLLLHGTGDQRLTQQCSQTLYDNYGTKGTRMLHLFEEDNHSLTKNSLLAEEMLCNFIARCAGVPYSNGDRELMVKQQL